MSKLQNYFLYSFFLTDALPQGVTEFCSLLYHDFFFLDVIKVRTSKKVQKISHLCWHLFIKQKKKKSIVKEGQEWIAQRWALEYGSVHIVSLRM